MDTHNDCSKQSYLRQINFILMRKNTQTPLQIEYTKTFASVIVHV